MATQIHAPEPYLLRDPALFREQAYFDGTWCDADDGETLEVVDPDTDVPLGRVPKMGAAETRRAIAAAETAWADWRERPATERAGLLRRWYEEIVANVEDLATIMTAEEGKPIAESRKEVAYGASFISWFAEEAVRVYGETIPAANRHSRIVVVKQPVGVAAAITPWNFPNAMITRKCGPALAAGCPIVVKPASQTPYSALALAVLAERAGIPPGIVNVLTGSSSEIGGELTANPAVRKLSFTGSTEVGRKLMAQSADTLKRLSLELGGNAPFIVLDDADLDGALEAAMAGKFRNSGESCVAVNRFIVQDGIYDRFVEGLAERVAKLRVGNGFDDGVDVGPLIDDDGVKKVVAHMEDAVAKGARVLTGGGRAGGRRFEPTVLADATPEMRLQTDETFGPVAPVMRVTDDAEAVSIANATEFGLAAYVCTGSLQRMWRVSEALEYGMVGVNTGMISNAAAPFGGIKQSGFGREGSRHGIDEYLEMKYLCVSGL